MRRVVRPLSMVVLAYACCLPLAAQTGRSRALLIGIDHYPEDGLQQLPLRFAAKDALLVGKYAAGPRAGFDRVVSLTTNAGGNKVEAELVQMLLGARRGDRILLFISARGTARPGDRDGFIHTIHSAVSKPESTALAVSDIRDLIRGSPAEIVLLFADVSREPPQPLPDNRINAVLSRELGAIRAPAVAGILGSRPGSLSKEIPNLRFEPERQPGYGVFGYSLVRALSGGASPAGITLGDLFSRLSREIPGLTGAEQAPHGIGIERAGAARVLVGTGVPARPQTPLVAALRLIPRLAAFQLPQPCFAPAELREPDRLADRILARGSPDCRVETAAALGDQGQIYVTRYGLGDLLPNDPRKVTLEQFRLAARSFQAAVRLLPSDDIWSAMREKWTARQLFCEGRVEASRAKLEQAARLAGWRLPEAENALGIYFVESEAEKDYDRAVRHFLEAKRMSPWWMYPRHNLALVYLEMGDYAAAEREYRDAIRLAPWQPYLYYNLGLLLQRTNRARQAVQQYNVALRSYDEAVSTLDRRASEWLAGYPEEASVATARARVFRENKGEVHNALATAYESRGDFDRALAGYAAARLAKPDLCPAAYNEAALLQQLAERKDRGAVSPAALQLHAQVVSRCPQFHPSLIELGRLYLAAGRHPDALRSYTDALAAAPSSVAAARGLAGAQTAAGQFDNAIATLEKLIADRRPAHPALFEQLAETYEAASREQQACDAWRKAVQALPGVNYEGDESRLRRKANRCPPPPNS